MTFFLILLSIIVGITLGICTGLIPGIHVNLITVSMLALSAFLLKFASPLLLSCVIASMAITHTFLSTIPSIFLGAPDADNVLSVLPGHKLLLEGRGYEAVMLTVIGSLASLLLVVSLTPLLIPLLKVSYPFIKDKIGFILVFASIFLLYKESNSRWWAACVFLLAGVLGIVVLTSSFLKNPLFPLLSGLFGTSALIISFKSNTKIPSQVNDINPILPKEGLSAICTAVFTGSLCSTLPGLGPSQAAIIGSSWMKKSSAKSFLILIGGLSTVNMIASFITFFVIEKARNGAVISIAELLSSFDTKLLTIFIAVSLITAGIATILAMILTKWFAKLMSKINYKKLCLSIIALITILVILLSGFFGLLLLIIATCVGFIPPLKNVGRNHLMGCLLLPIILFFLL